jgi:RHS repeat-associated protein
MPFGEEIASGTGGRNSAQGYGGEDNIRQKFTQYERDSETNLEYAKARYYSYTHGRFTSIDPLMGNTLDPQSLNRYTYVLNDPLNQRDPDGLYPRSQHRFITFLMAAMLGVPNADAIGRGAGDRDNFWNVAFPFVWNFNKHFGRPKSPEQLDSYEGYKLGEELHLVEDNAPGGPHQLAGCDGGATNGCYGLGDRLLSALIHGAREIFGDSPDKSPDRQDGWEAAWDILRHHAPKNRQSTPYPKEVIRFITTFLNRHNLTIVGMQYISPDGSIQSSGVMLDPSRHRLISSSNINGVIVNIYEEIPKEKKPKEPKKSPKDKP